jgi:hypothetical protein
MRLGIWFLPLRSSRRIVSAAGSTQNGIVPFRLGEAAGCAAALTVKANTEVALLDGAKVRAKLAAQNAGPFTDA